MKKLFVLSTTKTATNDLKLAGMASFLGAEVLVSDAGTLDTIATSLHFQTHSIVLSADTLGNLCQREPAFQRLRETLLNASAIFLYGVSPNIHDELLQWLSGGTLVSSETVSGGGHGELPPGGKRFTSQLAGSQYPRVRGRVPTAVLVANGSRYVTTLIAVSGKPTFVCVQMGSCKLFVSTASDFPDSRREIGPDRGLEAFYDELLPLIIFVRAACEEFCWRGGWKGARLIVDDPLLRHRYGYLDFRQLFDSLQKHRYGATVAFIPWNYSRTAVRNASFFLQPMERFSLCIHGCDHSNNEYGSRDEDLLLYKSQLAVTRMQRHEARTGLSFERIMVFPQGRFSTSSLRALRAIDFLAAINSSVFPVDGEAAPVCLGDLLLPAVTGASGFPVFGRHYPKSAFPFLLDLFLGRPAFIVEHHDFFKEGFPTLEALVGCLNEHEPTLFWGSLSDTIQRICWKRAVSADHWEVLFFSNRFTLTNESDRRLSYRLLKEEPRSDEIVSLSVNRTPVPIVYRGSNIEIEISLRAGETANVQVEGTLRHAPEHAGGGTLEDGKVILRRVLSEFRDEFLARHPSMLAQAKRLVRLLRATSDRSEDSQSVLKS